MNLKKRLRHLAQASAAGRMFGKTTTLAKATKELGGVMLTHTHKQALDIKHKFGVEARSMEVNLDGLMGPFIFDHYAIESLLENAANKIEALEKENAELKIKNEELTQEISTAVEKLTPSGAW